MLQTDVKDEIVGRLDTLTLEQLQSVLKLVRKLSSSRLPASTPGENLLKFVGSISPEDLRAMEEAIEDCERIDLSEW